ncbi:MAG: MATE family efflux transporter [bacterium]|nr:MATE family efflux transporter [bacterium]
MGKAKETGRLRLRFWRLTGINILSNLTVPLASLVDTAMLGHLADIRFLAGVGLASIIFEYVYWSFGFLRMGTTGLTAQAHGSEDRDELHQILVRGLLTALVLAAAVLLLQRLLENAGFGLLSGAPEVESEGRRYFRARILGAPATLANFVLLGWFLGRERSHFVLTMTLAANLTNIALDYVFIMRMGMAAYGAGLATAASQYVMLGVAVALLFPELLHFRVGFSKLFEAHKVRELFALNRDILIRTIALVSAFAIFLNFSAILGTVVLAANTVLARIQTLAAYLIDGAAFATETLAGKLLGSRDRAGLTRLRWLALSGGVALSLPVIVPMLLAPAGILGILTSHGPTLAAGGRYSVWLAPTLVFGALAYIYDGLFLGLTRGRTLRNAMLFSTLIVFVPIALYALQHRSNDLLWLAMVAFMIARTLSLALADRLLREPL